MSSAHRSGASIVGVGTSMFGKQQDLHPSQLVWRAVDEALTDAGVGPRELDAVYVGTVFGAPGVAQRALHAMGITDVPIITVENACASGTTALHEAVTAVEIERFGTVLAVGIEKMTDQFAGAIHPESTDIEGRGGLALPSLYAMAATRYQAVYGLTDSDLAAVAVKNHAHAVHNERAHYRTAHTVEEVLASRMIADPLTLMQCCPIADGAAAAVVTRRSNVGGEVIVRSSVLRSGSAWDHRSDHVWGFAVVRDTAAQAFERAGIGPGDVDVIECHDAFTIGEIVTTEAIGLAPEGAGVDLLRAGHTAIGGPQPVNPSGGLLSRGHPLGATGLAQTAEIYWQLRGIAGGRQVADARIGLVETMGGGVAGVDGNACVVLVLERT
jgi:acetyl-CoA acetyltransferase